MHKIWKCVTVGALTIAVGACTTGAGENGSSAPVPDGVEAESTNTGRETRSVEDFASLDELARALGDMDVPCDEPVDTEGPTHVVRSCDSALLMAHFSSPDAMGDYVRNYVRMGQVVIRGDDWFVTGRSENLSGALRGLAP